MIKRRLTMKKGFTCALVRFVTIASLLLFNSASYAKNVIFFLGDGMGISTVTAARIFAGQAAGATGEEYDLAFDQFPHLALIKTYNTDAQVPDSAGTITAITTGEKTRIGVLGVNSSVERDDCAGALTNTLPTLAELAEQRGMSTGIVSTARITHATPAGAYAHSPTRTWESSASPPRGCCGASFARLTSRRVVCKGERAARVGVAPLLGVAELNAQGRVVDADKEALEHHIHSEVVESDVTPVVDGEQHVEMRMSTLRANLHPTVAVDTLHMRIVGIPNVTGRRRRQRRWYKWRWAVRGVRGGW